MCVCILPKGHPARLTEKAAATETPRSVFPVTLLGQEERVFLMLPMDALITHKPFPTRAQCVCQRGQCAPSSSGTSDAHASAAAQAGAG